jgi:hypothetical protein
MSEAEFERRQPAGSTSSFTAGSDGLESPNAASESETILPRIASTPTTTIGRSRTPRAKSVKPRRVQRMFALEEELDKKLWLYAIHVGKDRSDVVNDLLRPVVASMVLYDSRDRRSGRAAEPATEVEQGAE